MRIRFDSIFSVNNGMVSPKATIQIGGVTMSSGVSFGKGVSIGGIDMTEHIGKDLEVDIINGVHVIKGIYN